MHPYNCKLMLFASFVSVLAGCGASAVRSVPLAPPATSPATVEVEPPGFELKVVENGKHMPFGYGTIPTIGMSRVPHTTPYLTPVEPAGLAAVAAK